MPNRLLVRYTFRHGAVHNPDDRMARYVVRLSTALGDLRISAHYATRARQPYAERLYFIRLTASHLREIVFLIDPEPRGPIPTVDDFLKSLPRGTTPSRAEIRRSHRKAMRLLEKPMAKGRPPITTRKGKQRHPKLRDDLKMLRNGFFHYSHLEHGDDALIGAMRALGGESAEYVVRQQTLRAGYADDIASTLAHPFPHRQRAEFSCDMHGRIVEFLDPVATLIQQIEAAWLAAHADDVIARIPGRRPITLAQYLKA